MCRDTELQCLTKRMDFWMFNFNIRTSNICLFLAILGTTWAFFTRFFFLFKECLVGKWGGWELLCLHWSLSLTHKLILFSHTPSTDIMSQGSSTKVINKWYIPYFDQSLMENATPRFLFLPVMLLLIIGFYLPNWRETKLSLLAFR